MAQEIGALRAMLSASAAQFENDMGRARQAVRSSASAMERAMDGAKRGFNGAMQVMKLMSVAAASGAVALGYLLNKALESADSMTKLAQSVGVPVQTLSAMSHAADLSGTSLDGLAKGLGRLARNMSDAADGLETSRRAFRQLGVDIYDSSGNLKSMDEIIPEMADRFASMEDGTKKTALAMILLGRSGMDLIPMLNRGGAGIKEMTDEAARLGIVIDQETGQAAERFRDNLTRLEGVKTGLVNTIMTAVLPTLENFSDSMVDSAGKTKNLAQAGEVANTALKLLLSTGSFIIGAFKTVGEVIGGVAAALWSFVHGDWKQSWETAKDVLKGYRDNVKNTADSIVDIWAKTGEKIKDTKLEPPSVKSTVKPPEVPQTDKSVESLVTNFVTAQAKAWDAMQEQEIQKGADFLEIQKANQEASIQAKADAYDLEQQMAIEQGQAIMAMQQEQIEKDRELAAAKMEATRIGLQALATAFPKMKAFALGEAIISTHQAITNALATKPFVPTGLAMAALAAAKGFAAVRAIQSGGISTGGGTSSYSYGGASQTVSAAQAVQSPQSVTIAVSGGTKTMTEREQAEMVLKALDDYLGETGNKLPSGRTISIVNGG